MEYNIYPIVSQYILKIHSGN